VKIVPDPELEEGGHSGDEETAQRWVPPPALLGCPDIPVVRSKILFGGRVQLMEAADTTALDVMYSDDCDNEPPMPLHVMVESYYRYARFVTTLFTSLVSRGMVMTDFKLENVAAFRPSLQVPALFRMIDVDSVISLADEPDSSAGGDDESTYTLTDTIDGRGLKLLAMQPANLWYSMLLSLLRMAFDIDDETAQAAGARDYAKVQRFRALLSVNTTELLLNNLQLGSTDPILTPRHPVATGLVNLDLKGHAEIPAKLFADFAEVMKSAPATEPHIGTLLSLVQRAQGSLRPGKL